MAPLLLLNRRPYGQFAAYVLVGIVGIESINWLRMLAIPVPNRRFPEQYVTRGMWSPYALVRPPHPRGSDCIDPVRASHRLVHGDPDLYGEFTSRGSHFVYPPTATLVLLPFGWIAHQANEGLANQCFDITCRLATLCMSLAALTLLRGVLQTWRNWLLGLLVIAAFFPIRWAICCVNVQVLINIWLVGAILAYAFRRRLLCGLLLGAVCSLKPCLAVLVLFVFARREWKTGLTTMATAGGLTLIAFLALGAEPWRAYAFDVLPCMSAGYAIHSNQSFLGALRRWFGDPAAINLIPASPGVRVFGWCASAVLVALALLARAPGSKTSARMIANDACAGSDRGWAPPEALYRIGDMSIALFAALLASPIAWEHYYGWAIVAFCMSLIAACRLNLSTQYYALIGLCYVLMGTDWVPVAANRPGLLSLLDSPKLFSALILSATLWYMCRRLAVGLDTAQPAVRTRSDV
jgi:hypothetical protein